MFCSKCGNKSPEGSAFCQKCGAILAVDSSTLPPTQTPEKQTGIFNSVSTVASVGFTVIAILSILAYFMPNYMPSFITRAFTSTDYVRTVRSFAAFPNSDVTVGTLANRFMSSARFQSRVQSGDLAFVDLSGGVTDVDGRELNVVLTFRLTPFDGRDDVYNIHRHVLEIDGRFYNAAGAEEFFSDLFNTYDGGFDSIAAYYLALGLSDGIARFFMNEPSFI